jgi:Ca-activated chloride channel family protein
MFLSTINPGIVPTQGTSLSDAIRLSIKSFNQEEKKYKTLILISDGEDHEEDALEATEEATDNGIVIYTIGVGTAQGAPIPVYRNGQRTKDFRKDRSGSVVLSKLNETILQKVAAGGNGQYFALSSGKEVTDILSQISSLDKKEIEEGEFTDFEDWFQIPVAIALVLLTLEFFLSERKNLWIRNWSIFKTK